MIIEKLWPAMASFTSEGASSAGSPVHLGPAPWAGMCLLAIAFAAHCREIVTQKNYPQAKLRALPVFLVDPAAVVTALFLSREVLFATELGRIAFYANLAYVGAHLVIFGRHFFVKAFSTRFGIVHSAIDATLLGTAALAASSLFAPRPVMLAGLIAMPMATFGVPLLERLIEWRSAPRPAAA